MNKTETYELAGWIVAQAKKAGADEASVNISKSRDIEIDCRERKVEKLKESTQNSLSLSIYANSRYSNHSTNDLSRAALGTFVSEAVAMTKYLSEDPFRTLPEAKYYQGRETRDLHIFDPSYEGLSSDARVALAREVEDAALAESDKIISTTASFSDSFFETVKVHSNGFEGDRIGTSFSIGADATVRGNGDARPEDWDWRTVRFRKDLPAGEVIGKQAVQRALRKIGQTKLDSGRYDMIVENRAGSRLLGALIGPMNARSLQQKRSFLEGKLGQKIGSEKLTIIDDPFIDYGMGSRLYDGEGMATRKRVMIDKGVLKSYYVDTYYGKKLGMEPTTGSTSNLVFDYGDQSLDEMVKGLQRGILVTNFIGGNSNGTTGDFSFGIMGILIENGEPVKAVNEMNISGNSTELWNQLVALGNDAYPFSSWRRPSLYFKDVQFAGV
ncbi:MAG: TldD/PmbA family protein [candidate division Zixibacteria bacterium]|nr:TldD/PmbA family protein [candidate division Zixibacteria bacterium]MDH3938130.1 TldD/PmbA family protein [candidate division Zixibacteria bacterium]MDH4033299.1 TldD/PmbA family protein [candidate division Zixibacteria bacterium]